MNRIKILREARNIDQKVLAIDLGVSQPTISDWENGKKQPSSKSAAKIADYFNVSIDYLLGRDTPSSPAGVVMGYGGDEQKVIRYETEEERIVAEAAIEAYRKAKLSEK